MRSCEIRDLSAAIERKTLPWIVSLLNASPAINVYEERLWVLIISWHPQAIKMKDAPYVSARFEIQDLGHYNSIDHN